MSLQLLLLCKSPKRAKQLHWALWAIGVFWGRKCCSEEENSTVTNTVGTSRFTVATAVWTAAEFYQFWATFPQQHVTLKAFSHCNADYRPLSKALGASRCEPRQKFDSHVTEGFPFILKIISKGICSFWINTWNVSHRWMQASPVCRRLWAVWAWFSQRVFCKVRRAKVNAHGDAETRCLWTGNWPSTVLQTLMEPNSSVLLPKELKSKTQRAQETHF